MGSLPWVVGGLGLLALVAAASSSSASSSSSTGDDLVEDLVDDGRPILIIGDSYAVGIAAALRALYPGRDIRSLAVGGTSSGSMQVAPDEDLFIIVSTGTNDVGIHEPTPATVAGILRVLGPYAAHTATRGRLFYVLAQTNMDARWPTLRARVGQLRAMLEPRLVASERFKFGAPEIMPSASGDGLHFDAAGYRAIAQQAMRALAPAHAPPWNPPAPGQALEQGEVTPAMTAWAVELVHSSEPMHSIHEKTFDGRTVLARVEWHTVQAATGAHGLFRAVTLYNPSAWPPAAGSNGSKSGLLQNGDLDPAFRARALLISQRTGIPLDYLLAVMGFETGMTFRSDIQNKKSHATGLIQFMPKLNGQVMHYDPGAKTTDELAQMSALQQLDHVERHFLNFGSFANKDPSDAYLAVFSPAMRGLPDDHKFYQEGSIEYAQNAGLDTNKDGAISVGEVRRIILPTLAKVRSKGWA